MGRRGCAAKTTLEMAGRVLLGERRRACNQSRLGLQSVQAGRRALAPRKTCWSGRPAQGKLTQRKKKTGVFIVQVRIRKRIRTALSVHQAGAEPWRRAPTSAPGARADERASAAQLVPGFEIARGRAGMPVPSGNTRAAGIAQGAVLHFRPWPLWQLPQCHRSHTCKELGEGRRHGAGRGVSARAHAEAVTAQAGNLRSRASRRGSAGSAAAPSTAPPPPLNRCHTKHNDCELEWRASQPHTSWWEAALTGSAGP